MDGLFEDEEGDDNDDVENTMFVRKLTRRHQFNATVTHIPKNTSMSRATPTSASLTNDGSHDEQKILISQNR